MSEVENFFEGRAEEFRLGELTIMAERIAFPLPAYMNGEVTVFRSASELEAQLREWRDDLLRQDYVETRVQLSNSHKIAEDRVQIDVLWAHNNSRGKTIEWCQVTYFLTKFSDEAWRISMVELLAQADAARVMA